MGVDDQKRRAAEAASLLVQDGMSVGLGTGTTVAYLLPALAACGLDLTCVATSPRTEAIAAALGLHVEPFDGLARLDLAIDGADQVARDGWVIKGGGGAHTREKVVAAAADRFVVIVDASKVVSRLRAPVPVELLAFGLASTLQTIAPATVRDVERTPDGGVLADYRGPVDDPGALARWLDGVAGVVSHGLFAPDLVDKVLVGRDDGVETVTIGGAR